MYVRKKRIHGKEYYYLVKSVREGRIVIQKFIEYLGPDMPSKSHLERIMRKAEENGE
ncbi:MAG: hypothetical protein NTU61_04885 [Candidatus Altiarchaeota archaeon]|nr:hypothetical protein [Candidatus Altiarchaeota archaeon]